MRATEITISGQVVVVRGEQDEIAGACRARTLSADDGLRRFETIDGETVTLNIGAIALIRAAAEKRQRGAFGFAREFEGGC